MKTEEVLKLRIRDKILLRNRKIGVAIGEVVAIDDYRRVIGVKITNGVFTTYDEIPYRLAERITNKSEKSYGIPPLVVNRHVLECEEMMSYLYLPIKMAGTAIKAIDALRLPKRLNWVMPLISNVIDLEEVLGNNLKDFYIYLTAKKLYVTPDNPGNRPGWHGDGFGTDDINYIWSDLHPTLFCIQDFENISEDHIKSMQQMTQQIKSENITNYGNNTLLRLTEHNIHRTPDIGKGCMRTFVKISISKHKYNLKGNSHNYKFDYSWKMYSRSELRNNPYAAEQDYIKTEDE